MKGILKNFTRVFKRYQNPLLPLKLRFEIPDHITTFRQKLFYKSLENRNLKGYFMFAISVGVIPLNMAKEDVIQFIANFTLNSTPDDAMEYLKQKLLYVHKKKVSNIEWEDRKKVEITFEGKKIVAKRLTECFGGLAEEHPVLFTTERYGQCHWRSIELSQKIQPDEDEKISVVTGSITGFAKDAKILHTWVEIEIGGEQTKVCDFTANVLMDKEDYYKIYSVKPLEKISSEQIHEDMKLFDMLDDNPKSYVNKDNFVKLYLSSREECMKKLKKEIDKLELQK